MKVLLLIVLGLLVAWTCYQGFVVYQKVQVGKKLAADIEAFSFENETATTSILVLGDSTAVGVGLDESINSTAGRLHQDFENAEIINKSVSGDKIHDTLEIAKEVEKEYDFTLIQTGANDIIYFASLEEAKRDLRALFQKSKTFSQDIVYLAAGNLGLSSMFPYPLNVYYTAQSKRYLREFEKIAKEENVVFVDLFSKAGEPPFEGSFRQYEAADGLHLNKTGYGVWYEEIRKAMREQNINLEESK